MSMWAALQLVLGVAAVSYGMHRCLQLDVATGRRDAMSLLDDYGSNRGYYWPWSMLVQVGLVACLLVPITLAIT